MKSSFYNELKELLNNSSLLEEESLTQTGQPLIEKDTLDQENEQGEQVVDDPGNNQDGYDENIDDSQLDDANYMEPPQDQQAPPPEENRKVVHLFQSYHQLLKMASSLLNELQNLSSDLIDNITYKYLDLVKKQLDKLIEKIREHLLYNYDKKSYEENLYIFMLLRSELLTSIKLLRSSMKLNNKNTNNIKK